MDLVNNGGGLYNYMNKHKLLDDIFPSLFNENSKLFIEGKKRCKDCDNIFDLNNFTSNDGGDYRARCGECHKKYQKEYYQLVRPNRLKEEGRVKKKELWSQGKKRCTKCKVIKDIETDFYTNPKNNKVQSKCRDCIHEYNIIRKPAKENGTKWKLSLREEGKKRCYRCGEIKLLDEFGINIKNKTDGRATACKVCKSITDKEYRENPKHKQKNLDRKKEYYQKVKNTEHYINYTENRKQFRDYKKEYQSIQKDEFRRFKDKLRKSTNSAFNRFDKEWVKKDTKTEVLLGADFFVVKEFIERQFLPGMNWDNHGEWHIDHVIPLDAADGDMDKLKRLCYYENLSPTWGKDNLSKGWKVPLICTLWENPIVPYKVDNLVIVPRYDGIVGRYKLQITPGERYGNLTILSDADSKTLKSGEKRMVTCECDCGNVLDLSLNSIRQGTTSSCGCMRRVKLLEFFITKKLLFSDNEIKIMINFIDLYQKNTKLSDDFINQFPGRTKKQILSYIRKIRNGDFKRLEVINGK